MAPSLDKKLQPSNYDTVVPGLRNQKHGVVAESAALPKIASTQYSLYILMLTHLIATALVSMSMSKSKLLANKGPIITL